MNSAIDLFLSIIVVHRYTFYTWEFCFWIIYGYWYEIFNRWISGKYCLHFILAKNQNKNYSITKLRPLWLFLNKGLTLWLVFTVKIRFYHILKIGKYSLYILNHEFIFKTYKADILLSTMGHITNTILFCYVYFKTVTETQIISSMKWLMLVILFLLK